MARRDRDGQANAFLAVILRRPGHCRRATRLHRRADSLMEGRAKGAHAAQAAQTAALLPDEDQVGLWLAVALQHHPDAFHAAVREIEVRRGRTRAPRTSSGGTRGRHHGMRVWICFNASGSSSRIIRSTAVVTAWLTVW